MKKKIITGIVGLILILVAINYLKKTRVSLPDYENPPPQIANTLKTEITVDASQNLGKMPFFFRTGYFSTEFFTKLPSDKTTYLNEKFFSENFPGMVTIIIPMSSGSFEDYKTKVEGEEKLLKPQIEKAKLILKNGGKVLIDFQTVPKWLSSKPENELHWKYPPSDYDKWKELIVYIVRYLENNGLNDVSYRVWEEADLDDFWKGTDEEFQEFYKHSVQAIKSVNPKAKITFGNAISKNEFLLKMMNYAKQNNVSLDYIIYHPFMAIPLTDNHLDETEHLTNWLGQSGLDTNTPLHAESWNSWLEFGRPPLKSGEPDERSEERDTEYNSAYIVSNLIAMESAGINLHSFFSDIDWGHAKYETKENQQFYGDFGFLTRDLVIKPSYNAFKVLSKLIGKEEGQISDRINVDFDEYKFVSGIASQTQDRAKIRVVLANFISDESIEKIQHEYSKKYLKEVKINFQNLPFSGQAKLTTYTVDLDHSNACRYNYKTAKNKSTPCGINGEIDKMVTKRENTGEINNLPQVSLEGSKQTKIINIHQNGSYQTTTIMQPYSVILIEIHLPK